MGYALAAAIGFVAGVVVCLALAYMWGGYVDLKGWSDAG